MIERTYKSKVDWWFHSGIVLVALGCVAAFLRTNVWAMLGMLILAMGIFHVLFHTYYVITTDETLVAHCSFFPEKKIAIADIEALEASSMPISSYALSLDRILIWTKGKPWMLISPENQTDFIKQLRKINPEIQLR